jgi:hypothetical protein
MLKMIVVSALALLLALGQARADDIKVKNDTVQFDAENKQDAQGHTCNLMAMIVDPSRPEAVNFRLIHALSPQALFFGFSLDVGDMRYQNGLPAGLNKVALASGDISTTSFSSDGRMYGGPAPDGGISKSTMDKATAENLWQDFLTGKFSIHFRRANANAQPRTYIIDKPIPAESLSKYLACRTEIEDIALGTPRNPDQYAKISRGGPGITEPMKMEKTPDHPISSIIPPLSEEPPIVGKR